jgi:enamine deaminase RidA (YjgF/YER057c/UK114 family)
MFATQWSLGTRAGDFVYVAGMRGIDPAANALVPDAVGRVRQAFLSIVLLLMWRICRFS